MCFSLQASAVMAAVGAAVSYFAWRRLNWKIGVFLLTFTVMQLIHVLAYIHINDCTHPLNQAAAYANHVHISLQPVAYLIGIHGILEAIGKSNRRIAQHYNVLIYGALVAGALAILRLFGDTQHHSCEWCGPPCSFSGKHHVDFSVPLTKENYFAPGPFIHAFFFFIVGLFISDGSAIATVLMAVITFVPAQFLQVSGTEAATIWCFGSIAQILITVALMFFLRRRLPTPRP